MLLKFGGIKPKNISMRYTKIDWLLLRKQKETLVNLIHHSDLALFEKEHLDGLIYLLDQLQDSAVEDGGLTEMEVFGKDFSKDEEETA